MLSSGLIGTERATGAECENVNGSGRVAPHHMYTPYTYTHTYTSTAHTLYLTLNGHSLNRSDPQRSACSHHGNGGGTHALTGLGDE